MKRSFWILLGCAGALAAQELTPRQLFYKDDAPAPKPAPKSQMKRPAGTKKAEAKTTTPQSTLPDGRGSDSAREGAPAAPAPKVMSAAYVGGDRPLGLRYALTQVVNGAEAEVSPTATFHSGDSVRVKVEGNRDGYLYVIARGSSGNWKPLFPAPDINGGDNKIVGHRGYRLPSDTQVFSFDEQAGDERLFVVFSAEPVKDMDELIPSLTPPVVKPGKDLPRPGPMIVASANPINDDMVSRLRNTYSRDLIVQTVTPSAPAPAASAGPATLPEGAVYVVNRSGGRVVADIKLEHK
jgi:hypothetical protein